MRLSGDYARVFLRRTSICGFGRSSLQRATARSCDYGLPTVTFDSGSSRTSWLDCYAKSVIWGTTSESSSTRTAEFARSRFRLPWGPLLPLTCCLRSRLFHHHQFKLLFLKMKSSHQKPLRSILATRSIRLLQVHRISSRSQRHRQPPQAIRPNTIPYLSAAVSDSARPTCCTRSVTSSGAIDLDLASSTCRANGS